VGEPTPMASLLAVLSSTPATAAMADFIRATPALSLHFGPGHNLTLLVPTDEAFLAFCKKSEQPCAKLAHQPNLRLALLLDHLLLGLPTRRLFTTLGGTEITVTNTDKGSSLMPSNTGLSHLRPSLLLTDPISVPGMGSLILIDAVIHSAAALNDDIDDLEEEQEFATEGSTTAEDTTSLPLESNLKFEDDLLTINMGALLAEVRDDSVNFPANILQEKMEKEIDGVEESVGEEEEKSIEEVNAVELDAPGSQLPATEFFILDPNDKTSFDSFQNSSPFFLLNRRNIEKKQKIEKVEKDGEKKREEVMEGGKSLKTRVVYINNQRLELPPDSR